jgi:hypothetical protein
MTESLVRANPGCLVDPSCPDVFAFKVSALDALRIANFGVLLRDTDSGTAAERGRRTEDLHE